MAPRELILQLPFNPIMVSNQVAGLLFVFLFGLLGFFVVVGVFVCLFVLACCRFLFIAVLVYLFILWGFFGGWDFLTLNSWSL